VKKVMISSFSALAMYALLCAVFGDPLNYVSSQKNELVTNKMVGVFVLKLDCMF
jgi:hypothetical protein